jgi:hypothetical protein
MMLAQVLLLVGLSLQEPKEPAVVDEKRVGEAVTKGIAYLKGAPSPAYEDSFPNSDELLLWTFVHAGVPDSDPVFQKYFKRVTEGPLERTYKVALQAMILEEVDRAKHQKRIYACAQFLVDNQCRNGQWSYGEPTNIPDVTGDDAKKPAATPTRSGVRDLGPGEGGAKPAIAQKILVRKLREGGDVGDNSNTQYAALGLRACHDSGIVLPNDVITLALRWLRACQHGDKKGTLSGKGWDYDGTKGSRIDPTFAMTSGALGSLAIYNYMLDRDWKKESTLKAGAQWLGNHFWAEVPEKSEDDWWQYYALYSLERAGMLTGADKFGEHDWYAEGAKALLGAQQPDGSWASGAKDKAAWNTCFAILFLKRATKPLVASVDERKKQPPEKK